METTINGVHDLGVVANMYSVFGMNGRVMTPVKKYKLDRGVLIHSCQYAMNEAMYVVVDDNMNAIKLNPYRNSESPNTDTNWDRQVNLEDDQYLVSDWFPPRIHLQENSVRPYGELYGIGYYFDESGDLVSDEIIADSEKYCAFLQRVIDEEKRVKEEASNAERKRCETEYAHLTRVDLIESYKEKRKATGNNLRAELKKHFPTTKFSVRYSSFSGGDAYDIRWTDGPTYDDVDKVADKFQLYRPDELSQGDYWDPHSTHFTRMYGDASYINCHRDISEEAISNARQKLLEYCPRLTDDNVNNMPLPMSHHSNFRDINEAARSYAWQLDMQEPAKEEPKSKPKKQTVTGEFKLIDYSEKCVAVTGDTKTIKDQLKKLGGRFNGKLSCGAGWVFPKSKVEQLKQLLGL